MLPRLSPWRTRVSDAGHGVTTPASPANAEVMPAGSPRPCAAGRQRHAAVRGSGLELGGDALRAEPVEDAGDECLVDAAHERRCDVDHRVEGAVAQAHAPIVLLGLVAEIRED